MSPTVLPFYSVDDLRKIGMRRQCGGCGACCFVLDVPTVTRFRTQCRHFVEGEGCGIWGGPGGPGGQPRICAVWRCAWAMGFGEETDRPDKSGILVEFSPRTSITLEPSAFYAIGVREGSERARKARAAMFHISHDTGFPVHLTDRDRNVLEVIEAI